MIPLLQTRDLTLGVGGRTFCQGLDWSIQPNQRWAILGPNGAGKTTLLHALAGLRGVKGGEIRLSGQVLSHCSRRSIAQSLGILFQEYDYLFPATVLETVLAGRHPHIPFWGFESGQDRALACEALIGTGLSGLETRLVSSLSGGEKRRMELATLLTQAPRLMLLDEPTNHLDLNYQIAMLNLFTHQVHQSSGAMVMVLHDLNLAARYCDYFLFLFGTGETLHGPREEMLQAGVLSRLFSHPMRALSQGEEVCWVPG